MRPHDRFRLISLTLAIVLHVPVFGHAARHTVLNNYCARLFGFLESGGSRTEFFDSSNLDWLEQAQVTIQQLALPGESPVQTMVRLMDKGFSIPSEGERIRQRDLALADPLFRASLETEVTPALPSFLQNSFQVSQVRSDLTFVKVDYARATLPANIVETAFFNLVQQLIPAIYRRSSLVKDEPMSIAKLRDRLVDSKEIHTFMFGFHPLIWNSLLHRLNGILKKFGELNSGVSLSEERASEFSGEVNQVTQFLYPSYIVVTGHSPGSGSTYRSLNQCQGCTVTYFGLVRNSTPDPLGVIRQDLTPTQEQGQAFYAAAIKASPMETHIELQSHTPIHDRFYRRMGFYFLRNEPIDPNWPDHPIIKTFAGVRERILEFFGSAP